MAILKVARLGHPVLRQKAEPMTRSQIRSAETQRLIDDMIETLHEYEGVGLAAPQVHMPVRLALVEVPAGEEREAVALTVLVNPNVTPLGDERAYGWEGCLSLPDLRGVVPRQQRVRLEALDRQGRPFDLEAEGFFARVIQHECDHLDGVTFVDRMDDLSSLSFLREFERHVGLETGPIED